MLSPLHAAVQTSRLREDFPPGTPPRWRRAPGSLAFFATPAISSRAELGCVALASALWCAAVEEAVRVMGGLSRAYLLFYNGSMAAAWCVSPLDVAGVQHALGAA